MYTIHRLSNGLRVVCLPQKGVHVCYCGLVINVGSRDEEEGEYGVAHFVEHTVFKGTSHRSANQILNRLDSVGGELNAYTTKEDTAVHASFLPCHLERAMELIADMVFNSSFPEKEIEREKEVIMDEISSYEDSPSDIILDNFESKAFKGTALGHNILGTTETVGRFGAEDARRFCMRTHSTDQMALAVWGDVDERRVMHYAEKYFGVERDIKGRGERQTVSTFGKFEEQVARDTHQTHVLMGWKAPSAHDDMRISAAVVSNLLGGPAMNSRLNVALREKNGIAYNIETSYSAFDDIGLQTIYFGTDSKNTERSLRIVAREIDKIAQKAMTERSLNAVLKQYEGQILMSADSGESVMLSAARSALLYDASPTVEEICEQVREGVTAASIMEAAQMLGEESRSMLIYT